jgi:hypothetical protein
MYMFVRGFHSHMAPFSILKPVLSLSLYCDLSLYCERGTGASHYQFIKLTRSLKFSDYFSRYWSIPIHICMHKCENNMHF